MRSSGKLLPAGRIGLRIPGQEPLWLILLLLTALGIALRLWQYLSNGSLNHDDICLALNVIQRSAIGLSHTLDFDQAAPFAFLCMERLLVLALGHGEQTLRLLPFVVGCASVVAFWQLSMKLLPRLECTLVLGFFAFSQALIGSGIQFKPYSLDVLLAVILVLVCLPLTKDSPQRTERLIACVLGSVALWFSFPALFILAGAGSVIAATTLIYGQFARLRWLSPIFVAWLVSAGLAFRFSIRPGLLNARLARIDAAFLFPVHAPKQMVPWLIDAALNLGSISTSVRLGSLMAVAFLFAVVTVLLRRDRLGLILVAPIALCWLGAMVQRYAWLPRLIFFLAPLTLIVTAREIGYYSRRRAARFRIVVTCLACGALLYAGLSAVKNGVLRDPGFDDPRGAVAAIAQEWQPGDQIYASGAGLPCIIFYGSSAMQGAVVSSRNPVYVPGEVEIERIASLPKTEGRLWFIYFEPNETGFDTGTLGHFQQRASLIHTSHHKHYTVALWNLDSKSNPG